jgi:hypothetical protein
MATPGYAQCVAVYIAAGVDMLVRLLHTAAAMSSCDSQAK